MSILLELTWHGALMLVVVTSLDRLCATRINARMRRVWWLLVPLAFLVTVTLPVLPATKLDASRSTEQQGAAAVLVKVTTHPGGRDATVAPSLPVAFLALVVVLAGSSVYLLVVLGRTCAALRRWNRVPPCLDARLLLALEECKAQACITTPVGLAVSERVQMPLLLGWWRPRILLPAVLVASLSREQLRSVFFHELAHLRARDVPCTFLFALVCALHWFNPASHLALRWWAQCREEAADEAAIQWLGQASGVSYGETLLRVLRHTHEQSAGRAFLALSIVESVGQLRTRLTMIKHHQRKSSHPLFVGTVFVAAALGIFLRPVRAQNAPAQTGTSSPETGAKPVLTPSTLSLDDKPALIAEFKRRDYKLPETLIDERVNTIVTEDYKGDHVAFVRALSAQGFTEEKFREAEREKVMVQAMRYRLVADAQEAKAQTIILPQIKVADARLFDVAELLTKEVRRLAPQIQDMSVQIDPQAPPAFKEVKVTLDLTNVSLREVVRAVAQQTGGKAGAGRQGLEIRAEDFAGSSAAPSASVSPTSITDGVHTLPIPRAYPSAGAEVVDSPACKDFVARLVSAINSKDQGKIKALLHPKCLPWLSEKKEDANFPLSRLEVYASLTIPEQRNVWVSTIASDVGLPWPDGVVWPVRPTNLVGIGFKDTSGQKTGLSVFVAADGDRWYEVVSIPHP